MYPVKWVNNNIKQYGIYDWTGNEFRHFSRTETTKITNAIDTQGTQLMINNISLNNICLENVEIDCDDLRMNILGEIDSAVDTFLENHL